MYKTIACGTYASDLTEIAMAVLDCDSADSVAKEVDWSSHKDNVS